MNNTSSYSNVGEIRAAAILTASYVVAKTFGVDKTEGPYGKDSTHLVLDYDFTKGSLTSVLIKVEYSVDNVDWFQHTSVAVSSGEGVTSLLEYSVAVSGKGSIAVPLINHPYLRVSAKANGTVTSSLLSLNAIFLKA